MKLHTPPQNQGQTVEISYAVTPEGVVMRVFDQSDHREYYRIAKWTPALERWADSIGPWNSPPPGRTRYGRRMSRREVVTALDEDA